MSTSFWLDQSVGNKKNYDMVVIGAGITGLGTAYWLKREDPSLKIAVIEKSRVAFGATGRNAGFITCGSVEHFNRLVERWGAERAKEIWMFSEDNLALLREHVIQGDAEKLDFEMKGSFSLASTDKEFTELKKTAELMKSFNIAVDTLQGVDIQKRLGAVEFVGGIKYLSDASVHPVKMANKMLSLLDGVDILELTEVYGFEELSGGMLKVKTDRVEIECQAAIMALNGYSASLHPYFANKIYPTRGQVMTTEPVPRFMEGPCYANFVLDYFRQLPDGTMLIGGFRQISKETEVGYSDHITDVIQSALYDFLQTYLPQLKNKKVTHRWSGVMGFSADGQPMIGSIPELPQVYFVGGYTGHGIGLAFNSAKCMVDMIYGRQIPDFISAKRF